MIRGAAARVVGSNRGVACDPASSNEDARLRPQAVAAGGMSIGAKGMMVAAKVMALTGADLFSSPATIEAAKAELVRRRGANFAYTTALGAQKPQLDYRKGSVP